MFTTCSTLVSVRALRSDAISDTPDINTENASGGTIGGRVTCADEGADASTEPRYGEAAATALLLATKAWPLT